MSGKQNHKTQRNGVPANATTDGYFGLFGQHQCGIAPGVDQQLLTDQQLQQASGRARGNCRYSKRSLED